MSHIKDTLKTLREQRGLSIKKVADALGMPKSTYASYEYGDREPNIATILKIADLYNVTTDYLFGREPRQDALQLLISQTDLSADAQERLYMALPEEAQAIVLQIMRMLRENRERESNSSNTSNSSN